MVCGWWRVMKKISPSTHKEKNVEKTSYPLQYEVLERCTRRSPRHDDDRKLRQFVARLTLTEKSHSPKSVDAVHRAIRIIAAIRVRVGNTWLGHVLTVEHDGGDVQCQGQSHASGDIAQHHRFADAAALTLPFPPHIHEHIYTYTQFTLNQ